MDAVGDYFHHATPGLGPVIEVYQNKDFGEKRKEKAVQGMVYLDKVLQSRSYLAGDQFSMADITGFCGLLFAAFAKIEMPAGLPALRDWQKRVGARPSIQSA
jgi:glutathione S-transferase